MTVISKISIDENIPEEVAEFVIDSMASLMSIMAILPSASIPNIPTCTYRNLLALIETYIRANMFASDLTPYQHANQILQSVYNAMEAYLD